MSRDCCVALPHDATGLSPVFFIVVFPDHTHYFVPYACCAVLCVLSSFAIVFVGKRELVVLLCLSI